MSIKKASFPKTKHHARLVRGRVLPGERIDFSFPILGIKEARILRERGSRASAGEELTVYCESITEEGQNALLKVLEEPATGVMFVILVPRSIQLLPTLLSRLEVADRETDESKEDLTEIKKFVNAGFDSRLKIIAELIKRSEKTGENSKSLALKFLDGLEVYLSRVVGVKAMKEDLIFALAEIRQGRVYLDDKSGTTKLVLEHIALVLPT
ncbi:hypothetical protein IT398_02860 [Candidatus Nomurabacteria bacterium]|nr:hypothetical protein [Candidatus Nomurabacteria bacterium]